MNKELMFSSKTGKYDTPADLIADLNTVFKWNLDVCASRPNVCDVYYNELENGLISPWGLLNFCNPPYGRGDNGCKPWLEKGVHVWLQEAKTTVFLIPARTDTNWWHDSVPHASQVVFIRGRLKFGDETNSAPFPSAFVVIGELTTEQSKKLASYGWSIQLENE